MRAVSLIAALELSAAACAGIGRSAARPPLEHEGELVVALLPLPPSAERFAIEIRDVSAIRSDGTTLPLEVLAVRIGGGGVKRQRMVARGRLAPAQYSGITLTIVRRDAEDAARAPESQPVLVPFAVGRRQAIVLHLELGSVDARAGAKAFAARIAPRTLPQVATYCTDFDSHDVAVLGKLARQVDEVLPTGRGPWGVAIDTLAERAYVALSGEDQISVVDVATGTEVNRIRLNVGDTPREIALTPDGRLLLSANAGSNSVSFIDPAAFVEISRAAVGHEPTALLVDRRGARAYVTNRGSNTITVLDVAARALAGTVSTDDHPLRPQIDRAGSRLYVVHPASPFLLVFSLPDLSLLRRVYVGLSNTALKVDPVTDLIYVAKSGDPRISVYDPFSLIPIAAVDALAGVTYMVIDEAQNALFALAPDQGSVAVVELAHRKLTALVDVGAAPRVLALVGERN